MYVQVSGEKEFFAQMVVDAVSRLDPPTWDLRLVGVKKVIGGGLRDSFLVDGVAFKKTFSYAGFEQQPKAFKGAPTATQCAPGVAAAGQALLHACSGQLCAHLIARCAFALHLLPRRPQDPAAEH